MHSCCAPEAQKRNSSHSRLLSARTVKCTGPDVLKLKLLMCGRQSGDFSAPQR